MPQRAENTIRIAPPTDARMIDLFSQLLSKVSTPDANFIVNVGEVNIGIFNDRTGVEKRISNVNFDASKLIMTMQISVPFQNSQLLITFKRSISEMTQNGHLTHTASLYQNELAAFNSGQGQQIPPEIYLPVWSMLTKFAADYQPEVGVSSEPSAPWVDALGGHIAQLASLQTQLLQDAERARIQAAKERQQLLKQAEADIEALRADAKS